MLVGLRISEGRLGVQMGRWGFSLRFGVQIGRWGFRLGSDGGFRLSLEGDWGVGVQIGAGGGSDWAVGVQIGSGRGSDWVGYGPDPIAIATFARDQESGKNTQIRTEPPPPNLNPLQTQSEPSPPNLNPQSQN